MKYKTGFVTVFLIVFSVMLLGFSLLLGRYPVSFTDIFSVLKQAASGLEQNVSPQAFTAIMYIRLPRILAAFLIGASLSCAGAAGQGVFRNKLVSPDIVGAASGAAFGACVGLLFSLSALHAQLLAFSCGLSAVALTGFIASRAGGGVNTLILSGIMVSAIGNSLVSLVKIFADAQNVLPSVTFWLLGSLTSITWVQVASLVLPFCAGFAPLLWFGWRLNILSLGDSEARSLGLPAGLLRAIVIVCITLLTASSVSVSGVIGWVGLLVPHAARLITGEDYRRVLPVSALLGGCFLVCVDDFARSFSAAEVPLGVLTSLVGAPFFLALIVQRGRRVFK